MSQESLFMLQYIKNQKIEKGNAMYTMGIPLSDERFTIFAKVHASEIMHLQGHLSSYIFPT